MSIFNRNTGNQNGGINGGIINSAINTANPGKLTAPATTPVSTYTATQSVIDPSKTVQGRLAGLMDPNDPMNQAAVTTAKQQAANSGLLNSSMAATGATDAIIKNAMNIATPDANNYAQNQQFNANAENIAGATNAGAFNAAGLQANSLGYDAAKTNKLQDFTVANNATQQTNDLAKLAVTTGSSEKIAQMSADTQKFVAGLSSDTQKALAAMNNESQAAISAAHDRNAAILQNSAGAQTLFLNYLNDIASINSNTAIIDKTAALTNVGAMMQAGMDAYAAGKMPDITHLLEEMNKVSDAGTTAPPPQNGDWRNNRDLP